MEKDVLPERDKTRALVVVLFVVTCASPETNMVPM
jgi:hypothetical protein